MATAAAPSNSLLPLVAVKGGLGGRPSIAWERNPFERSRASSLSDNPTASGAASVGTSPVRLNGVTVTSVPWSVASLKDDDSTDGDVRL